MKRIALIITTLLISLVLLAGYVKGTVGPMHYQIVKDTALGGPFEASNSTARYALTESLALDHSVLLNPVLAKFASPDVVDYKGKFMSIFTPGVSFLGLPFFMIGNLFGYPQLGAYTLTLLIALFNVYLIALVSKKIGAGLIAGLIAGCIFLFASNGLAYSLTFTQHHASTAIVLLGLLLTFGNISWKKFLALGALFGIGILIDIPNAFFLTPVFLYMFAKSLQTETVKQKLTVIWKPTVLWILIGILPFIAIFVLYNIATTGSPTKLGQTIGRSHAFRTTKPQLQIDNNASTIPETAKPIGLSLPFETRAELQGAYILLLSNERSWLYYSPILLLGIVGFIFVYKNKETKGKGLLILAIILVDIVLYSMFGDPWGGWAFGPRYLIPSAALMCILLGVAIQHFRKNPVWIAAFTTLLLYSIFVNSLGALTTTAIPPKVEAVSLPSHIPYTYKYNQQLLQKNFSGSLVYNSFFAGNLEESNYYYFLAGETVVLFVGLYVLLLLKGEKVQ